MSKQVKFISKSVMGVMTVGVVAMVGATAEAHVVVVDGRCIRHSLECVRRDSDVPDPVPNIRGELIARVEGVQIMCKGASFFQRLILNEKITLRAQKQIVQSEITNVLTTPNVGTTSDKLSRYIEWAVIVSNAHFLNLPDPPCPVQDAIVDSVSIEMNAYCNPKTDSKCSSKPDEPHSSLKANCKLDVDPTNLPSHGTPYVCTEFTTCHENCAK